MIPGVIYQSIIHVDGTYFFFAQILETNWLTYFFTSNDNIGLLEQQQFFQWILKKLRDNENKDGLLLPIRWPQARWRVSCIPQGACLLMRREWYWAISYTEVWVVASDWQVMYWAPDKKTAVALKCLSTHSAVVQSFTSDTVRAVAVYRTSGHAISQLLSRNKSVISAHAQVSRSGFKRRSHISVPSFL